MTQELFGARTGRHKVPQPQMGNWFKLPESLFGAGRCPHQICRGAREASEVIDPEHVRLLFEPYQAPPLRRGDRAFCLVRDYAVVVIGLSGARIPWPRCVRLERPRYGRGGLLIDDELARAIRHESATAVAYWWGVHLSTVLNWRKALGVTRTNNEGTHRLVLGAIDQTLKARFGGGAGRRGSSPFPARGRTAVWTPEEVALLGALSDAEVARRTGRSQSAVLKKRGQLGRPAVTDQGGAYCHRFWTVEEDEAVRTLSPEEAVRVTGRTLRAIYNRKRYLERGQPAQQT